MVMVTDAIHFQREFKDWEVGSGGLWCSFITLKSTIAFSIIINYWSSSVPLCTTHFMLHRCHIRFIIPCPCVHFPKGCELLVTCLPLMLRIILVYHRELTDNCWKVRLDYCTGTNQTTFYGNKIKEYLRLKKKTLNCLSALWGILGLEMVSVNKEWGFVPYINDF